MIARMFSICVTVLLAACGGGNDKVAEPVDESLGLDARPDNVSCLGEVDFPRLLSDHPCFSGEPPVASSALIPYEVNAPLWSDGADKMRYLAVPNGRALQVMRGGKFELPPGGVLVKEFADAGVRLETRLLVRSETGTWKATTYVWNAAQTDAVRTREGASIDGPASTWAVPSEEQCFECHTEAAAVSLGLEQNQMALRMEYAATGRTADQVHTLRELGLLEGESDAPALVSPGDSEAGLEDRARAYLHANCSHCHRPGGLGEGQIDLRASTSFRLTNTCDEPPITADPVPGGGLILAPGDPENSALYLRMTQTDPTWRMPPVGSDVVDVGGSQLLSDWISSLDTCP